MTFKFKAERAGAHVRVAVFAGEDVDHLALCGNLTFREPEWDQFRVGMERSDVGVVIEWR